VGPKKWTNPPVAPAKTGTPIAPAKRYSATAAPPKTGPRVKPDNNANKFCKTMGTGVNGSGIEIKAPAAVNAAKRAVKLTPVSERRLSPATPAFTVSPFTDLPDWSWFIFVKDFFGIKKS
jgi:hypothetical protein